MIVTLDLLEYPLNTESFHKLSYARFSANLQMEMNHTILMIVCTIHVHSWGVQFPCSSFDLISRSVSLIEQQLIYAQQPYLVFLPLPHIIKRKSETVAVMSV